jgi:hypothetical protein
MPRPTWSGILKLSLVSCPVYLSPATSEAERIRLNMINPATGMLNLYSLNSLIFHMDGGLVCGAAIHK